RKIVGLKTSLFPCLGSLLWIISDKRIICRRFRRARPWRGRSRRGRRRRGVRRPGGRGRRGRGARGGGRAGERLRPRDRRVGGLELEHEMLLAMEGQPLCLGLITRGARFDEMAPLAVGELAVKWIGDNLIVDSQLRTRREGDDLDGRLGGRRGRWGDGARPL